MEPQAEALLKNARQLPEGMPGTHAHTAVQMYSARKECAPGSGLCGPEVCEEKEEVPRPLLQPTLATSIQCSTTRALSGAFMLWSPRQVVMTQLATLLNWATVARMVGARCSLPFLSRWDQMEPRQW